MAYFNHVLYNHDNYCSAVAGVGNSGHRGCGQAAPGRLRRLRLYHAEHLKQKHARQHNNTTYTD